MTAGGGKLVKNKLFMVSLSAITHNKQLKAFYDNLIKNGKNKMLALTSVARKLMIIANNNIKNLELS